MPTTGLFGRIADNRNPASLAATMRRKRFAAFFSLIQDLGRGARVLDVGRTPEFWTSIGAAGEQLDLTILNRTAGAPARWPARIVSGDARDIRQFRDSDRTPFSYAGISVRPFKLRAALLSRSDLGSCRRPTA
jgi:hypothetical protein